MPKRTKKYEESLLESLQDPKEAAAYLNAHLEEAEAEDAEELFLMALRDIAKAYGMSEISEQTDLGRESLYKALSEFGNPKLHTLWLLFNAIGLRLLVEPKRKKYRIK
ncbi:MAG: putative addiction module antidote protein [Deltaproteobacteria bacterium RIFCSPHIGHO2_12_FULL_43_9]|nr:MAG: putative addiction module antidote protein [Deltaproteobacteria bacterium RIFCSPHIGHO2_12_FULL_43_9]